MLQPEYDFLVAEHACVLYRMCNDCLPDRSSLIAVKIKEKEKKRLRLLASIS